MTCKFVLVIYFPKSYPYSIVPIRKSAHLNVQDLQNFYSHIYVQLGPSTKSMYIQRVNGRGQLFFHVKLNLTDPCRTIRVSTTVEGCQAGGLGHLFQYMREYIAKSPCKTGQQKGSILLKRQLALTILLLFFIYYCTCLRLHRRP